MKLYGAGYWRPVSGNGGAKEISIAVGGHDGLILVNWCSLMVHIMSGLKSALTVVL
jgi:hypothetical protein